MHVTRIALAGAVAAGSLLTACSAPAKHAALPVPTCGWVHVRATLSASSMQHSAARAVTALHLDRTVTVLGIASVRADDPLATKVGLPTGPRALWLVYTSEPVASHSQAVVPSSASSTHVLHIVDDETLQPGGSVICPG